MESISLSPVFAARTRTGLTKFWQKEILRDGDTYFTRSISWQATKGGGTSQRIESVPARIEPKNVGRANATTPAQQAASEVESEIQKKRAKGYLPEGETAPDAALPLPMLALSFTKRGHAIVWPCQVQPKLDGVRCLTDGRVFWSRTGKVFDAPVVAHLQFDTHGTIVDGELMLPHGQFTFQESMTAIKKYRPDLSPALEYHVYDLVDETAPFTERHRRLTAIAAASMAPNVRLVETCEALDESAVSDHHARFTAAGFEGTMLRNRGGRYEIGQRSTALQKLKDFVDGEFTIVDVTDGRGRDEELAVFVCRTATGLQFHVRPRGTTDERAAMYRERASYVGRPLTVSYQNLTDEGIPRFPVGIGCREPWDGAAPAS